MNEKTIDLIQQMADKLGMSAETMIEWFASRAPWEFVSVGISILVFFIGVIFFMSAVKHQSKEKEKGNADELGVVIATAIFMIVGGAMMFGGFIGFTVDLRSAIMAIASPEAYAIEQIAKLL